MILRNGGPAYKHAFDIMASSSSGAVLFHCTAGMYPAQSGKTLCAILNIVQFFWLFCTSGKDRAGMLAALVLLALGVDEELVCWDYEQTELALRRKQV